MNSVRALQLLELLLLDLVFFVFVIGFLFVHHHADGDDAEEDHDDKRGDEVAEGLLVVPFAGEARQFFIAPLGGFGALVLIHVHL